MGIWAPVVVIGLMIVHGFVPFPAELLAVCVGAIFGTLMGATLIWVGAMIAFNPINYAAGLTRVPVWTFIWTTGLALVRSAHLLAKK